MIPVATYEEGQKILKRSKNCGECNGTLILAWDGEHNTYALRCGNNKEHKGLAREFKLSSMDTPDELNIGNMSRVRRERLVTQIGEEKTTALAQYSGKGYLTLPEAKEIITTIWPGAPAVEVQKAALVCKLYGLNPLMKHLYLIPFNTKVGDRWEKSFSMVLGIKASRIIARRKGEYAYLDDTPRIMTEAEQVKIFGEVDKENVCAITRLQDRKGNTAIGTGKWSKETAVKGIDKGNSKLNMAMIRSERQALERLFPDSLPSEVPDVVDERYQELEDGRQVDLTTGEVVKSLEQRQKEADEAEAEMDQEYEKSKAVDGQFTEQPETPQTAPPEDSKAKRDPKTVKTVGDLFQACFEDYKMGPGAVLRELGIKAKQEIVDPSESFAQIQSVR